MAQRSFILLLFNLCLVAGQDPQYVLKGTEAKLLPGKTISQPQEILWKHNGDKVIEFDGSEEKVFGQYENRVTLSWDSAELNIADVRHEDSGLYELDAFIRGQVYRSQLSLKVLDKVTKPIVSCKMVDESLHNVSGQQARLMCSSGSEQPQDLKFEWHSNGKAQPGQELTINVGDKYDDDEHSCTVSNPVHTETTTFTTKECYPGESSAQTTTIALVVTLVALVLLVICVAIFCLRKRLCQAFQGRRQSNDVEKQKEVLNERATHEEHRPLVHRQSTLLSKQPLHNFPQSHQNDSDQDDHEEIADLDALQRRKLVQKRLGSLNIRAPLQPATQRENDTENMSSPALPTNQSPHRDLNVNEDKDPQVENLAPNVEESEPDDDTVQSSEDEQSDLQSPAASEQPENDKEKDEETMSPPALLTNQLPPHQDLNVDEDKGDDSDPTAKESDSGSDAVQPSEDPQSKLQSEQPENKAEKDEEGVSPSAPVSSPLPPSQNLNDNEDKDPQVKNSDPENPKESEPANDAVQSSEDEQSDLQSPTASEQPGSEKEEDENEEITSLPPNAVSSHTASPYSPLSQSAQIKETKDTDDEHKNDSSSDEVTEQTEEKNIRESDSSGAGEINESEEPSEKKQSTVTEHKGSEILSQKDEKSVAENECGSESEIAKVTNPSLDTTRSGVDLDQESNKVCQESKEQSDNSAAKDDKNNNQGEEKNDVECGSADKEPGNDHLSQAEKEQKADAVA